MTSEIIKMKVLKDKILTTCIGGNGKDIGVTGRDIKLVAVTDADRQRLRISTYQYLLP